MVAPLMSQPGPARPVAVRSLRYPITSDEPIRGAYGVPAYVRRLRNLEAAEQDLEARLTRLWFDHVRPVAAEMKAFLHLFANGQELWEFLDEGHFFPACQETSALVSQHPDYHKLSVRTGLFTAGRRTRYRTLGRAIRDFNQSWPSLTQTVDLEPINTLIADYNRWYPLERECAMRYAFHALDNFRPRPSVDPADLAWRRPLLPPID